MAWVKIPKEHHPLFEAAMPDDPRAEMMKMFGGVAGTVNGNMFGGLFADSVMVRLGDAERRKALAMDGATEFDPMGKGKPMKDMVLLPSRVLHDGKELRRWLAGALAYTATLPPKVKKPKTAKKKAAKKKARS